MNIELVVKQQIKKLDDAIDEAKRVIDLCEKERNEILSQQKKTESFLRECGNLGIKRVSIRNRDDKIKESYSFPFGVMHSVFAEGEHKGWPAIWRAVEKLGVGGGSGNRDQHQLKGDELIDGIYQIKNGKWSKLKTKGE